MKHLTSTTFLRDIFYGKPNSVRACPTKKDAASQSGFNYRHYQRVFFQMYWRFAQRNEFFHIENIIFEECKNERKTRRNKYLCVCLFYFSYFFLNIVLIFYNIGKYGMKWISNRVYVRESMERSMLAFSMTTVRTVVVVVIVVVSNWKNWYWLCNRKGISKSVQFNAQTHLSLVQTPTGPYR